MASHAERGRKPNKGGKTRGHAATAMIIITIIIIIIDNFYIALFSGVPKLTAFYILQHFLSFTNIIHIIMTTNNV